MKTTIEPTLVIEMNINCPICKEHIDLVSDTDLNEEGRLLDEVLSDEVWIDAHKKFKRRINCIYCGEELYLKGINW